MIKTNFIINSWSLWNKPLKQQPITEMYLATILENNFKNMEVKVTDLRGIDYKDRMTHIKESDIYFYSVTSPYFLEIKSIVEEVKNKYPDSKHIAGGKHINIFPEESLKTFDTIVLNDGEKSIVQLVKDFKENKLERLYDLKVDYSSETYPFPNRHFIPESRIVNKELFKSKPVLSTTAFFSRGCPYSCSFCANSPKKTYRKSIDNIVKEINYLKENYSIEGISILDDVCIPEKVDEAKTFIESMGKSEVYWRGQTRIGVNKNTLKLAHENGCLELAFGIESPSQQVLNSINKHIDINRVKETMKYCKDLGITIQACLINGLPNEPENIVELTKSFVKDTNPDVVMMSILTPYPGSPIERNPEKFGIKYINRDIKKYSNLSGRMTDEVPEFLFEYYPEFNGHKTFTKEQILNNFLELQDFLKERGMNK